MDPMIQKNKLPIVHFQSLLGSVNTTNQLFDVDEETKMRGQDTSMRAACLEGTQINADIAGICFSQPRVTPMLAMCDRPSRPDERLVPLPSNWTRYQ
jgi:hypothetical protein